MRHLSIRLRRAIGGHVLAASIAVIGGTASCHGSTLTEWTKLIEERNELRSRTGQAVTDEFVQSMVTLHGSLPPGSDDAELRAFRLELYMLCDSASYRSNQVDVAKASMLHEADCIHKARWANYALAAMQRGRQESQDPHRFARMEFALAAEALAACPTVKDVVARGDDALLMYLLVLSHVRALEPADATERVTRLRDLDDTVASITDAAKASNYLLDRLQVLTDMATHAATAGNHEAVFEAFDRAATLKDEKNLHRDGYAVLDAAFNVKSLTRQSRLALLADWLARRQHGINELRYVRNEIVSLQGAQTDRKAAASTARFLAGVVERAPSKLVDELDTEMARQLLDAGEEQVAMGLAMQPFRALVAEVVFSTSREAHVDKPLMQATARRLLVDYPDHPRREQFVAALDD